MRSWTCAVLRRYTFSAFFSNLLGHGFKLRTGNAQSLECFGQRAYYGKERAFWFANHLKDTNQTKYDVIPGYDNTTALARTRYGRLLKRDLTNEPS